MAYIECNSNQLRENGLEILKLVDNLKEVLTEYYNRIEKMTEVTGEWIGPTAEHFVASTISSKGNTMSLCDNLNLYGNFFVDSAEQINNKVKSDIL